MIALRLAFAWLMAAALGHAALSVLTDRRTRSDAGGVLCAATALGLGLGLSTLTWLAAALWFGPEVGSTAAVELLAIVGLKWAASRRADLTPAPHATPGAPRWLKVAALAGLCAALLTFLAQARMRPLGDGDALAIWGLRAVYLHRAFGNWDVVFDPAIVHTDYPLLVPAALARAWCFLGDEEPLAGLLLALTFGAATFAALGASAARAGGAIAGPLAMLGLAATPTFAVECSTQNADVPLACFTLLAAAWLRVAGGDGLRICGACLGCCVWTKNEGALVALSMCICLWWLYGRSPGRPSRRRALLQCMAGGLPALAALVLFKLSVAPGNDLIAGQRAENLLPMLTSTERWTTVSSSFARWFVCFRTQATAGLSPLLLALAVVVATGGRVRGALGIEFGTCLGFGAGLFAVFMLTPYDVQWHLDTALDRVMLQVWPLALLGAARTLSRAGAVGSPGLAARPALQPP